VPAADRNDRVVSAGCLLGRLSIVAEAQLAYGSAFTET